MGSARRSSRSKAKVGAAEGKGAEIVNYEATLLIANNAQSNNYKITIDQDSFNQMEYGIQFSVSEGAVTAPGFFSLGGNKYLFNFKEANEFNCLDQATFTAREMYFSVPAATKDGHFTMNDVIFTFPMDGPLDNKFQFLPSVTNSNQNGVLLEPKENLSDNLSSLLSAISTY